MSRPQQAPPSRTLFVRNIEPSTTEAELMNLFQSFGTVRKVASNLILSRHMAFVTFYDLRHAEAALACDGKELRGSSLQVVYSTPKEKEDERPDADTLMVCKMGDPSGAPIDTVDLARFYGQWGELKRIGENRRQNQAFVQYYDTRCFQEALKATEQGIDPFQGGRLVVEEARSNFRSRGPGGSSSEARYSSKDRRPVGRHVSRSPSPTRSSSRSRHPSSSSSSSRRRRSRSRSHSPARRRRSRSRSRSRSRDRRKSARSDSPPKPPGGQAWSAPPYGAPPVAAPPFVGGPAPPAQGADQQQILSLMQQNPQLVSMLMGVLQQQQQAPPMGGVGLPPMQPQHQPYQQPPPSSSHSQRYQNYGNSSSTTQYSPPGQHNYQAPPQQQYQQPPIPRPSSNPQPSLASGSLASLAASLERLRKK